MHGCSDTAPFAAPLLSNVERGSAIQLLSPMRSYPACCSVTELAAQLTSMLLSFSAIVQLLRPLISCLGTEETAQFLNYRAR